MTRHGECHATSDFPRAAVDDATPTNQDQLVGTQILRIEGPVAIDSGEVHNVASHIAMARERRIDVPANAGHYRAVSNVDVVVCEVNDLERIH